MESKKVRNSNMELLRILAIIMIIIAHVVHNGARYQLVDKTSISIMQNGLFCLPVFYKRLFLIAGILPFGNIGNAIFILISGYFMVERGKSIDLGKTSKKLLFQVGFGVLMRILIPIVYYKIVIPDAKSTINMGNINEFNSLWWFPGYYLLVIFIAGVFLNGFLEKISQKTYRNMLLVIFGVFSLCWPGGLLNSLADGFRTLTCGVFLYALGGYIKRYNPFGKIRTWVLFFVIIFTYLLMYLSYYGIVQTGIHSHLAKGRPDNEFIQPLYYVDNYTLSVVVIGVVLLELFSRIKIKNNRVINFIAGGSLIVYLLHGHGFWISLVQERDWITPLSQNPLFYCFEIL